MQDVYPNAGTRELSYSPFGQSRIGPSTDMVSSSLNTEVSHPCCSSFRRTWSITDSKSFGIQLISVSVMFQNRTKNGVQSNQKKGYILATLIMSLITAAAVVGISTVFGQ